MAASPHTVSVLHGRRRCCPNLAVSRYIRASRVFYGPAKTAGIPETYRACSPAAAITPVSAIIGRGKRANAARSWPGKKGYRSARSVTQTRVTNSSCHAGSRAANRGSFVRARERADHTSADDNARQRNGGAGPELI